MTTRCGFASALAPACGGSPDARVADAYRLSLDGWRALEAQGDHANARTQLDK